MKRFFAILAIFTLMITSLSAFGYEADAASSYIKNLTVKATGKTTTKLTWTKLNAKQQKTITGITVFRNNKAIKHIKKTAYTYSDTKLKANTKYTYQVKTYKNIKRTQWYNKQTKKWQTKKPVRKYCGKSRKVVVKKYANPSPKRAVTTKSPQNKPAEPQTDDEFYAPVINAINAYGNDFMDPLIMLYWFDVPSAEKYIVYKGSEKIEVDVKDHYLEDKDVTWSTTYTYKVAAVKGDKELLSKTVSATVPDKPLPKTAEYGTHFDVSAMYTYINEWRQDPKNQWYRAQGSGVATAPIIQVNSEDLVILERDEQLEKIAEQRAKEQWIVYFEQDKGRRYKHTRPDGQPYSETVYEMGMYPITELTADSLSGRINLKDCIYGTDNTQTPEAYAEAVANHDDYFCGWAETAYDYHGQGHRRGMLMTGPKVKKVGFGGFRVGNTEVIAMELAYYPDDTE